MIRILIVLILQIRSELFFLPQRYAVETVEQPVLANSAVEARWLADPLFLSRPDERDRARWNPRCSVECQEWGRLFLAVAPPCSDRRAAEDLLNTGLLTLLRSLTPLLFVDGDAKAAPFDLVLLWLRENINMIRPSHSPIYFYESQFSFNSWL